MKIEKIARNRCGGAGGGGPPPPQVASGATRIPLVLEHLPLRPRRRRRGGGGHNRGQARGEKVNARRAATSGVGERF